MEYSWFFIAVVAACLLWSAFFIAVAARTRPGLMRYVLVAAAVGMPMASLLPWAVAAGYLAFVMQVDTHWFAPTTTATISAAVGGVWIARAGLAPRGVPVAASWPIGNVVIMAMLSTAIAGGVMLFIDAAVTAEMLSVRTEAAAVIQSVVPSMPSPDDDAAPLYSQAFALLERDPSLAMPESPLTDHNVDLTDDAVAQLLTRHAITLDCLRRAAARPGCRFARDWSRPEVDLTCPHLPHFQKAARFMVLAARRQALDGDGQAALADVVRIHRMATHIAEEPLLVAGLVAISIDSLAFEALTTILPLLSADDLAALDTSPLGDFVRTTPSLTRHFLGEEACGLSVFAGLSDGSLSVALLVHSDGTSGEDGTTARPGAGPLTLFYRCFLLRADINAYRTYAKRFRQLADAVAGSKDSYAESCRRARQVEAAIPNGIVTKLFAPAIRPLLRLTARAETRARAAQVLLAVTRARLVNHAPPETVEALVPTFLPEMPMDPFLEAAPLVVKVSPEGWLVYSVGDNGKDDGGPSLPGQDKDCTDDVGLWLAPPLNGGHHHRALSHR